VEAEGHRYSMPAVDNPVEAVGRVRVGAEEVARSDYSIAEAGQGYAQDSAAVARSQFDRRLVDRWCCAHCQPHPCRRLCRLLRLALAVTGPSR
jgi:hypothetical protein